MQLQLEGDGGGGSGDDNGSRNVKDGRKMHDKSNATANKETLCDVVNLAGERERISNEQNGWRNVNDVVILFVGGGGESVRNGSI